MTISGPFTGLTLVRAFAGALCALAVATSALSAEPLSVCADPDNLPFSKSEGPERGLYVELAELVAKRLDATPVNYVWWLTYNQRRALRNTVAQGACDAVFALPTDADYKTRGLQKTPPFLDVGYAVVAPASIQFSSLNDLKGKRLAVQFQTTPHVVLSQLEGYSFTTYRTAQDVLDALAKGEVDAGFLWGPVAGYENMHQYGSRWRVTPLAGANMTGQVSVAVRRDKPDLAKRIEAALDALKPEIGALAVKYGFPLGKPVTISGANPTSGVNLTSGVKRVDASLAMVQVPAQMVALVQQKSTDAASPAAGPSKAKAKSHAATNAATPAAKEGGPAQVAAQAPVLSEQAALGRVRFNDQCAHCHGADGASAIRERDLRRLKMRYDDKWPDSATTTIKNGRNDLGMPPWKDILKDPDIAQILSFLETVQK